MLEQNRYGFVVSKKINKRAHIRNRSKRRLRAYVEELHKQLGCGNDLLFVLRQNLAKTSIKDVRAEMQKILSQARLLAV